MKKVKTTVTIDGNETPIEMSGYSIEKHLMLDAEGGKVPVPAIITSDGQLRMIVNTQFGYINHAQFKEVKMANLGTMPISILSLEKYYLAHEQGKLELLWK